MSQFKQDVMDLFSGKRGGHVEHWLYSDTLRKNFTGSQLWQEFLRASLNYYVVQNERELIKTVVPELSKKLPSIQTLVDFGVGDIDAIKYKVAPILKEFTTVKSYLGIDVSGTFLKAAKQQLADSFPKIKVHTVKADFYKNKVSLPEKNILGIMLGATISNMEMHQNYHFPKEHIVKRLTHLKDTVGKGNYLLVSYDANTDPKSIVEAYANPYMNRLVTGIMFDIAPLTKGGFFADKWQNTLVWNDKAHVLHQCAEATEDMKFSIDNKVFSITKGDQFVTVNLFKFPKTLFQSMCDEAGFEVNESYADHQNRMQLQLLKS